MAGSEGTCEGWLGGVLMNGTLGGASGRVGGSSGVMGGGGSGRSSNEGTAAGAPTDAEAVAGAVEVAAEGTEAVGLALRTFFANLRLWGLSTDCAGDEGGPAAGTGLPEPLDTGCMVNRCDFSFFLLVKVCLQPGCKHWWILDEGGGSLMFTLEARGGKHLTTGSGMEREYWTQDWYRPYRSSLLGARMVRLRVVIGFLLTLTLLVSPGSEVRGLVPGS